MASLDYALLAEYARVDPAGLITIVGGSFDRIQALKPNSAQQVFIALRVLVREDEPQVDVEIRIVPPNGEYDLTLSGVAQVNPEAQPIDGLLSVTMAMGAVVPLPSPGRYNIGVSLDHGVTTRELPFVVTVGQQQS